VRANYEFFVLEFANIVEGNTSIQTFSDRVLIIDEAHHLRANDTSDKNVQGRHGRSEDVFQREGPAADRDADVRPSGGDYPADQPAAHERR
jgi:hypothetical protein